MGRVRRGQGVDVARSLVLRERGICYDNGRDLNTIDDTLEKRSMRIAWEWILFCLKYEQLSTPRVRLACQILNDLFLRFYRRQAMGTYSGPGHRSWIESLKNMAVLRDKRSDTVPTYLSTLCTGWDGASEDRQKRPQEKEEEKKPQKNRSVLPDEKMLPKQFFSERDARRGPSPVDEQWTWRGKTKLLNFLGEKPARLCEHVFFPLSSDRDTRKHIHRGR